MVDGLRSLLLCSSLLPVMSSVSSQRSGRTEDEPSGRINVRIEEERDLDRLERYRRERDDARDELRRLQETVSDLRHDVERLRRQRDGAEDALEDIREKVRRGRPPRLEDRRRKTHRSRRHSKRYEQEKRSTSCPVRGRTSK